MRLLLGVLILIALFSAAALWQRSWRAEARSSREIFLDSPQGTNSTARGDGWSRVVLGRPSGGEPYEERSEVDPKAVPAATGDDPPGGPRESRQNHAPETEAPSRDPHALEKDVVVTVEAGQTLSGICHEHYGSARVELVLSVARYNQLSGPDEIREGQVISLPTVEKLNKAP